MSNSNRVNTDINLDNIEKFRSTSNRNPNIPVSTKNARPKLPLLEDMINREYNRTNNLNPGDLSNSETNLELRYKIHTPSNTKGFKDRYRVFIFFYKLSFKIKLYFQT